MLERKPDGSVTTAYESGSAAQHWTFEVFTVSLDEGCYSICSDSTGKYLDVNGGSYADEAPLQVYMGNGTLAQKFWLVRMIGAITLSNAPILPGIFRLESPTVPFFKSRTKKPTRPNGRLKSALGRGLSLRIKRPVRCCPFLVLADLLPALTRTGSRRKGGASRPSPLFLTVSMSSLPCMQLDNDLM